jgi:mRNA interferase RelE/StbE
MHMLRVPADIASLIRNLHPQIKSSVRLALNTILHDPNSGKFLKDELAGLRSYRVKRYRIVYRISSAKKELEIIAIGPRKNIYKETFRIISLKEKKK